MEAIQDFADDTRGQVELTKEYKKSRRRAVGAAALALMLGGAGFNQFFGGESTPNAADAASGNVSGGDKAASAPAPSRTPEQQAFACRIGSLVPLSASPNGLTVNLPVESSGTTSPVSFIAVPYKNQEFGTPLAKDTTDQTPGFNVVVPKGSYDTDIAVYAIAGSETTKCDVFDVTSADSQPHFADDAQDLPATYHP